MAVGHSDLTGDDFAEIFASAIGGQNLESSLGVTDVVLNDCSWSAKTVKKPNPFTCKKLRLISGRNSPDYSYDIENPRADLTLTGEAVLKIWNQRVDQSLNEYSDLRVVVLVRNMEAREFALFEYEAGRFTPSNYKWSLSKKGNLVGHDKATDMHCFTWQFHGSQFTIHKLVPGSVYKFRIIRKPGLIEMEHVLNLIHFQDDWIRRVE